MNVFVIPSWYPSVSNPIYGIFIAEQLRLLAHQRPDWNIGVVIWGQGDERKLLWGKHHVLNTSKVVRHWGDQPAVDHQENLIHYYEPALIWTRKLGSGNIKGIYKSVTAAYQKFTQKFGPVSLVHAHECYPGGNVAKALYEELHIPYVLSIHQSPFPMKSFLNRDGQMLDIIRAPMKSAYRIITTSNALDKRVSDLGFGNRFQLPYTLDTAFFKPQQVEPPKVPVLFTLGRLEEQKGFDILLDALTLVEGDWKLRIGGDGEQMKDLQAQVHDLGLSEKVEFLGLLNKEQVYEVMNNCSFFVLASRHETFGVVVLEAISCGKPVVATRCGGPEDIVNDINGLIVAPNDPEALAQGITEMLTKYTKYNPDELHNDIETRFGPESFASSLEDLYQLTVYDFS